MCEWATCKVLRYKVAHEDCPPPCCKCCDDRWILGCPKPIKIMCLQPYEEDKKYLVRSYVVRTCPQCQTENKEALPDSADPPPDSADPPPTGKQHERVQPAHADLVLPASRPPTRPRQRRS